MAPPVAGYIAWWDAAQITGVADGAPLTTWVDASGNGHDVTQGSVPNKPIYYNTTPAGLVNGQPAVWFAGTQVLETPGSLGQFQPYTVILVAGCTSLAASRMPWSSNAVNVFQQAASGDGHWQLLAGGLWSTTINMPVDTQAHFLAWGVSGSASYFYQDTTSQSGTSPGTLPLNSTFTLGQASGGGNAWVGPICEMIIYPSLLSSTDIATLRSYVGTKWVAPPFITGTVTVTVGPITVSASSTITSTTVTGTATLNIGPLRTASLSSSGGVTTMTAILVGPIKLAALGGRIGPGAWPVPGFRGRWRLTLHKRPFTPATLASTIIAELADARGRRLEQAWNTPAMLTFTLDGRSQSAALIEELVHDVVAWRWDDQTGQEFAVFRGTITQSEDQLTTENHVTTYTCHDYAATLTRRLLTSTYTVTARDQDLIAGDLLSRATAVSMSSGASLSPACFLPIGLLACNPDGSLRGLSGQNRDRTYYGSQNIGTALDDLAKITNGFDYDVAPSAVDDHDSLRIFYPQQGVTRTGGIALQYGSTVATVTRSVNSADYANYVRVLGNNQSANPTPQFYGEAAAAGAATTPAGIWMLADDAADVTVAAALGEKAVGDIALNAILVPHYTLGLAPGAYSWGNPNMGDTVPLIIQSGRLDVNTTVRVLGIAYDIGDDGQEDVTLTVSRPATRFSDFFNRSAQDIKSLARR
jgi:hypothetical protein